MNDRKNFGLLGRSRESSSALIDLGPGINYASGVSHELHVKIMLPADVRLPNYVAERADR